MAKKTDSGSRLRARHLRRIVLWGTLAGVLIYYALFLRRPPTGSGPAGPAVPAAAFQTVWHEGPVLLLGLGDSITDGFGASKGRSYFERLVANPEDEFPDMAGICLSAVFPELTRLNRSLSGSTSIDCAEQQVPSLPTADPDTLGIVAITTGGNDLIHMYGRTPPREGAMYGATLEQARPWIANFAIRLDAIVDGVIRRFPGGCHIFLANIYDPTDGVGDAPVVGLPDWPDGLAILAEYNRVIADCATRHDQVHLVDIHGPFLGHGIHCYQRWRHHYRPEDPHYWYHENIEDPNERGYDAIRRLFLLAMIDVFGAGG